jgi:hypothetical protein
VLPAFIVECRAKFKLEIIESKDVISFSSKFSDPLISKDGFVRR